jgi:uncharacterized membrane protein YphA (DoxX/SURF4 family)
MATPLRLVPLRVLVGGTLFVHGFARFFGGPNRKLPEPMLKYLGTEYQEWIEGGGISRFTEQLNDLGVPNPRGFAYVLAGAECFGGALFAAGKWTRISGLALAGELSASIYRVYWGHGMVGGGGWELPTLLLFGVLTVVASEE